MAVSNNWQQASAANSAALTLANYVVGSGNNKVLVVTTGAKDSGGVQGATIPSTVAWGSHGLTLVKSAANTLESGSGQGAAIWALLAPPAETHDIVVTWSEAQSVAVQVAACYLTDREQVLPTTLTSATSATADTGTTKWTLTVTGVPAGAYVVDCCSSSQTGGTHSATESGQVQKVNLLTTSSFLLASEREVVATADVTFGWVASVSSGRYGMAMAVFQPAAAGGGGTSHRRVLWAPAGAPQVNVAGSYTAQDASGTTIAATGTHTLGVQPIYVFGDVVVTMAPGQELLLADNNSDFSLIQGQAGWTYQWLIGSTYTNATVDNINNVWAKTGNQYWRIGPIHQEPVVDTDLTTKIYAVRKWTVTAGVTRLHITGTWSRISGGDGSDVQIIRWSGATQELRFRRVALLGQTVSIDQVFAVVAGDVIEFRVGVGPALNDAFDDTTLSALIYSSTAAVNAADDDQAALDQPGDPDLANAINAGLVLFVGGAPAGAQQVGTERLTRNKLLFVNGDASRADPDVSGWVVPEIIGVNGDAYFARPATWNADVGTRFALWMDVVIDAVDQWSALFSIPWQDAWGANPTVALSFGRSGTTTSAALQFTPSTTQVIVTGPAGSWPSVGRHTIGFARDGANVAFFLDGVQVGATVATAGTSAPGWAAAPKQKPISLLGRSETAATSQGTDGAVVQMRFWVGATIAQMVTRVATLQADRNVGRFTGGVRTPLPLGTVESKRFAQVPSDSRFWDASFIAHQQAAGLAMYGVRHDFKMVVQASPTGTIIMRINNVDVPSSFAGPWPKDTGGFYGDGFTTEWNMLFDAGMYLIGTLFEGAAKDKNGTPVFPTTATERGFWVDQAYDLIKYCVTGWPNMLVAVEIENEPDGTWPVSAADLNLIAPLLKTKLRADPALDHIAIIGPGALNTPGTFVDTLCNGAFLDSIDYWSHHHYVPSEKMLSRATTLTQKFTTGGKPNMKVVITEFGAHGSSNVYQNPTDFSMLQAIASQGSVKGWSYFPIEDYPPFFNNSGFLNTDGSLGEQGQVYLVWRSIIGESAVYVGEDNVGSTGAESHHFTVGGQHVRIMWSTKDAAIQSPPKPIGVDIVGSFTAKDQFGNSIAAAAYMVLTVFPIYVIGNITSVALSATQDTLLTESVADFSTTQGLNGWTYQWLEGTTYTNAQADAANNKWINPSYQFWQLGSSHMQPVRNAAGTTMVCSVRKYTVPSSVSPQNRVRVHATWNRSSTAGDGSGVSLWHWRGATSTLRYRELMVSVSPNVVEFNQTFDAVAGDVLEFRVDTGPALDDSFDDTTLIFNKETYGALIYKTSGPVTPPQDDTL